MFHTLNSVARRVVRKLAPYKHDCGGQFRPLLEWLEGRDVPASVTFDLGGVYGTATFTVPLDEVDAGEATQAVELDDLVVVTDGQVADADDFDDTPTANFAYGNFMGIGVTIVDSIPSQFTSIEIANTSVTGYSSPVNTVSTALYDPADTQATFTLSDGTAGAISYEVPWEDWDPGEASQSLPLSNFSLSIAGRVLTESTADYTTSPAMQFEYGAFTGLTFGIDTSTFSGFPYSDISATGTTISATVTGTSTGVTGVVVIPPITLTAETNHIPVNANNTNNSGWQVNGAGIPLVGFPSVRDFDLSPMRDLDGWVGTIYPPSGDPITDPELKRLTATVLGGQQGGSIQVQVFYSSPTQGGRIRLWTDRYKTSEIGSFHQLFGSEYSATLPGYPVSEFYVEGINPSLTVNDITVRVSSVLGAGTVTAEKTLTVTPIVTEFSVHPQDPPTATFLKDALGSIGGISSGEQADGADRGSTKPGATFTGDLNRRGISGTAVFVQNVTGLSTGSPAVILNDGTQFNTSLGTATLPLVDSVPGAAGFPIPFYPTGYVVNDSYRQLIYSVDTPAMADPQFLNKLNAMDITFQARLYLVWKYGDGTLYTLAQANWQAVFHALTLPVVGLTIMPDSVVTASPMTLTHIDPAKVVGPTFSASFAWLKL